MDKEAFKEFLELLRDNKKDVVSLSAEESAEMAARADKIGRSILKTPGGAELIRFLSENNITFRFSRDVKTAQFRERVAPNEGAWGVVPESQCIVMNPDIDDDMLVSAFLHEARHAQQALAGAFRPQNDVSPSEMAWYVRFVEADAQSEAVLKSFVMHLSGDSAAYASAQLFGYAAMFKAAEDGYTDDPSSLQDGRLKRMVFDAWFGAEESKAYYGMQVVEIEFPNRMALMERMPDHGLQKIPLRMADIEKIALCGGESFNYMTLPGFKSLNDPYYTGGFTEHVFNQLQSLGQDWENNAPVAKATTIKPTIKLGI